MIMPAIDTREQPAARVLIVDDEPSLLELLSDSLQHAGFEVITAACGPDAAEAAERYCPDLILLDIMLPGMDGFEVIRRLRSGGSHIPVIFMSARAAAEDKVRGLDLGGDDYITKPFSLEEVTARVRALLRRTPGTTPVRGRAEPRSS